MRTLVLTALLLAFCAPLLLGAGTQTPADPYETLRTAELFAFGGVGFMGAREPAELAFNEIIKTRDAAAVFRRLLSSATTEGQFYALVGLYRIDRKTFDEVVPPYLSGKMEVRAASGCTFTTEPAKHIAKRIKAGDYKAREGEWSESDAVLYQRGITVEPLGSSAASRP